MACHGGVKVSKLLLMGARGSRRGTHQSAGCTRLRPKRIASASGWQRQTSERPTRPWRSWKTASWICRYLSLVWCREVEPSLALALAMEVVGSCPQKPCVGFCQKLCHCLIESSIQCFLHKHVHAPSVARSVCYPPPPAFFCRTRLGPFLTVGAGCSAT